MMCSRSPPENSGMISGTLVVNANSPRSIARNTSRLVMALVVEKRLNTVVALGVGTRCDENGEDHVVAPILESLGYKLERAKTNIGLGRINRVPAPALAKETVNA